QELFLLPKSRIYEDVQDHRHYSAALNWSYAWGKIGTYLPTWIGVAASARKWFTIYSGESIPVDTTLLRLVSKDNNSIGQFILEQKSFDPWSVDFSTAGNYSFGKNI